MFKGWIGEIKTGFSLWAGLDSNLYHRFHDVIIPSSHGTTQVDHILVSPFGIFVVETKNYKGWIYGSEDQSAWTQVIYKSKHKFQNPPNDSNNNQSHNDCEIPTATTFLFYLLSKSTPWITTAS